MVNFKAQKCYRLPVLPVKDPFYNLCAITSIGSLELEWERKCTRLVGGRDQVLFVDHLRRTLGVLRGLPGVQRVNLLSKGSEHLINQGLLRGRIDQIKDEGDQDGARSYGDLHGVSQDISEGMSITASGLTNGRHDVGGKRDRRGRGCASLFNLFSFA